jgi:hypothetical protein
MKDVWRYASATPGAQCAMMGLTAQMPGLSVHSWDYPAPVSSIEPKDREF